MQPVETDSLYTQRSTAQRHSHDTNHHFNNDHLKGEPTSEQQAPCRTVVTGVPKQRLCTPVPASSSTGDSSAAPGSTIGAASVDSWAAGWTSGLLSSRSSAAADPELSATSRASGTGGTASAGPTASCPCCSETPGSTSRQARVCFKSKIMSYLAGVMVIGGQGGKYFEFTGINNGSTLKKIHTWAGGWQIRGIKIWLNDGRSQQFGKPEGKFSEFTVEDGERFSSLSLWGNGAGTRLGGIKFRTNRYREFFAKMTDWGLKTEYPIDVGCGICIGVKGRAGSDIDNLGFLFIKPIRSSVLKDVQYPTLHGLKPSVITEEIKSMTYRNNSSETQEYKIETSKTITKKSSWSVTNKSEFTLSMEVKAGIPEVVEVSGGFQYTVGTESSYGLENTEERTEVLSFPVKVPPRKTVDVNITIGRVKMDLPYKGTVQITCSDDRVLEFPTKGTYKGVTYTDATAVVNESKKLQ